MSLAGQLAGPDGAILDYNRLFGGAWPAQGSYPELLRLRQSWQKPSQFREALSSKIAQDFRVAMVCSDAFFFEACGISGPPLPAFVPIVPNIQGLMRDAVEYG